jgi:hypothetical protein
LHWDGTTLTRAVASSTDFLSGVWGSATNDVWAVLKIYYNSSQRV